MLFYDDFSLSWGSRIDWLLWSLNGYTSRKISANWCVNAYNILKRHYVKLVCWSFKMKPLDHYLFAVTLVGLTDDHDLLIDMKKGFMISQWSIAGFQDLAVFFLHACLFKSVIWKCAYVDNSFCRWISQWPTSTLRVRLDWNSNLQCMFCLFSIHVRNLLNGSHTVTFALHMLVWHGCFHSTFSLLVHHFP